MIRVTWSFRTQGAAVGVAGRKGAGAVLRNVPEALIGQVAHIGNDVQALHLGQELEALLLQAGLGVGQHTVSPLPALLSQETLL